MRIAKLALAGALGVAALSTGAQATPAAAPHDGGPSIVQVRGGCGPGYRPHGWRDRYGYWHTRCVPEYYEPPRRYYGWPEPRGGWGWRY